MTDQMMYQQAPYPTELADLVENTKICRSNWRMWLEDDCVRDPAATHGGEGRGLSLIIYTENEDAYHPGRNRPVNHLFIVPAATYNRENWQRWLFDQFAKVMLHEAMETFEVDGVKPFAPHHGPGNDPYTVFHHGTDVDVRTSYLGEVKPLE